MLFGPGEIENDNPICRYFRELPTLAFSGNEVMINAALCREQWKKELFVQDITQQEIFERVGPLYYINQLCCNRKSKSVNFFPKLVPSFRGVRQ